MSSGYHRSEDGRGRRNKRSREETLGGGEVSTVEGEEVAKERGLGSLVKKRRTDFIDRESTLVLGSSRNNGSSDPTVRIEPRCRCRPENYESGRES